VVGTVVKIVIAFCIGAAALSGAQRLWLTGMQHLMAQAEQDPSYLPPSQPVTVDISKTQEWLDNQPKFDFQAAARAGVEGRLRDMEMRNRAAQAGAPQIANGIPTMPGQGVPLQFYHPPGVPFH
jgi:hypothetical protein